MNKIRYIFLSSYTLLIVSSCASSNARTDITFDSYDAKMNRTEYAKIPGGLVYLPGKWVKWRVQEASGQVFLKNDEGITVGVAINAGDSYEFYQAGDTDSSLIQKFYDWDAGHFAKTPGGKVTLLDEAKATNVKIWRFVHAERNLDSQFLFQAQNGYLFNITISGSGWDTKKQTAFLKSIERQSR